MLCHNEEKIFFCFPYVFFVFGRVDSGTASESKSCDRMGLGLAQWDEILDLDKMNTLLLFCWSFDSREVTSCSDCVIYVGRYS